MLQAIDISTSALIAQRTRLNTISNNIANTSTVIDEYGRPNPYRRKFTVFAPGDPGGAGEQGVHVAGIYDDAKPFVQRFEPGHPAADSEGYVSYPNVDLSEEFVNALGATRAYEANIAAIEMTKAMAASTLRILA